MQPQTNHDQAHAEQAIRVMEAELIQFSIRFISDNTIRRNYQAQIKQYAQQLLEHLRRGEISPEEAARLANQTRNETMNALRLKSSDIGRAYAESLKPEGKLLPELSRWN
jgi:hypothetical protein